MRWLLRVLLDDADRRAVESDLAELYEFHRRQDGDRAAARWLRRQQRLYPLHVLADRLRSVLSLGVSTMPHLWRDVVYSLRSLARTPALTLTIVLTVGVGLGATTGMMSIVRAVLVSPLPYAAPDELVWIYTDNQPYRFPFSVVDIRALEADHPAFSAVAGYQRSRVTIVTPEGAEQVTARSVTGSYFPLLGQKPAIGRLFDAGDGARDDRTAVLTHAFWTRQFGGDSSVLGRSISIDGTPYTVVGVLERATGPFEANVAVFTPARWPTPKRKGPFFVTALGRLRPDVSREAAVEMLRATNARLFPIWRSSYQDEKASWGMQDLKARVVGDVGTTLFFVLAAVGCVLVIACVNAVNLLIARALSRTREIAIRGALGAPRGRLVQQLLIESGLLTVSAAIVGVAIAIWAIGLVQAHGAGYLPRLDEVRLSGPVLGWLALLTGVSAVVIGLVPAIHSSRVRMDRALASGGRGASDAPAARKLRRALIALEFALATPLLIGAVLVATSLDRLGRVDIGIEAERILTGGVLLAGPRYADNTARRAFWTRAVERLRALPGVEAVALTDSRPPQEANNINNFDLEDRPTPPGDNQPLCPWIAASEDFFRTVGLRIQQGRQLEAHDFIQDAPPVIVVDRAWADRFFPGQEVLGRRLREGGCTTCPWTDVVGVVGTVKFSGLDAPDQGTVYYPFVDAANGYAVLRTEGDPAALSNALRGAFRELDPGLAPTGIATGDALVSDSLAGSRSITLLVGFFALTAVVLSVVGIYGVMAHFVQQHTRDIGIRLALGGEPSAVRRMVVVRGLRLVVIGVALGVAASFVIARLVTTALFGVSPTDPGTLVLVPVVLVSIAAAACLLPARRAARLNPIDVLRES